MPISEGFPSKIFEQRSISFNIYKNHHSHPEIPSTLLGTSECSLPSSALRKCSAFIQLLCGSGPKEGDLQRKTSDHTSRQPGELCYFLSGGYVKAKYCTLMPTTRKDN